MSKDHTPRHKVGDEVIITGNTSDHQFMIGEKVKIIDIEPDDKIETYEGKSEKNEYYWWFNDNDCEPVNDPIKTQFGRLTNLLELIELTGTQSTTTSGADFYSEVIEMREKLKEEMEKIYK